MTTFVQALAAWPDIKQWDWKVMTGKLTVAFDAAIERIGGVRRFNKSRFDDALFAGLTADFSKFGHCAHHAFSLFATLSPVDLFRDGAFFYNIGTSTVPQSKGQFKEEKHVALLFVSNDQSATFYFEPSYGGGFCIDLSTRTDFRGNACFTKLAQQYEFEVSHVGPLATDGLSVKGLQGNVYNWRSDGVFVHYDMGVARDLCRTVVGQDKLLIVSFEEAHDYNARSMKLLTGLVASNWFANKAKNDVAMADDLKHVFDSEQQYLFKRALGLLSFDAGACVELRRALSDALAVHPLVSNDSSLRTSDAVSYLRDRLAASGPGV